ncbi:MAG TPA: adenosylcobalamin-dependent ribonucleoside-diphosphate reductase, partial [Armatimonadetes bacterium]|nr:adenosylcobalamin-dependent ribonucleoside-diphosphate reductase [Armatimonadota bacterium]
DPGLIFIDRINEDNPTPHVGRIESTNPCGEQPLLPWESCNLGSINLSKMVRNGDIDWERLRHVVRVGVHFLDNVIDMNKYPLPEIERMTKANRKIGLGVMGFADMLIKLGIPYDSEEALKLAERIMRFIQEEGRKTSVELAKQRGVFPNWKGSIYDRPGGLKLRNATITTIAPTGTISIIAGCSSGIEPLFAIAYRRRVLDGELRDVHPEFERIAREEGFWSESLMERIEGSLSIQGIEEIPAHIRRLFLTAYDIPPEWHVRMQAAFQKFTDNAVSKTVNLPPESTVEDVKRIFMLAWRLRCKGITVFRYGSKQGVIEVVKDEAEGKAKAVEPERVEVKRGELRPRPRPQVVKGRTIRMRTGCGNLYVTVNEDEHGLFEVFTSMGKTGGCVASFTEAIARLISVALRSGIEVEEIIEQLKGIRCPMPRWDEGAVIRSCADAIAKAIEIYLGRDVRERSPAEPQVMSAPKEEKRKQLATMVGLSPQCPECGGMLEVVEGCVVCRSCGYTRCE